MMCLFGDDCENEGDHTDDNDNDDDDDVCVCDDGNVK